MSENDIRWKQRFKNFCKAFNLLEEAVQLYVAGEMSELEQQGLIQRFEFTHELAWNVIKDYFVHQGVVSITGSRDAVREAFNYGLIVDGDGWMEMIKSRNLSTHTYSDEISEQIIQKISELYYFLFRDFKAKMETYL